MTVAANTDKRLSLDKRALTRRTSLTLPDAMPLDSWVSVGQEIAVISDASAWWLADWLIYGREAYPDRYRHAVDRTGLSYQTLRNYAWIARAFPMSRRRDRLSMQHHAEVVTLVDDEQDEWLDRAEHHGWSVTELRRQLKGGRTSPRGRGSTFVLRMNIDQERQRRWEQAAERAGADLAFWVSKALDQAAIAVLRNESRA
ncbi:LmbU family transcriptional regulator [Actinomadura sp. DC4]|uniref:LmbU family transcriptional regulator n=1 Tax=Actinomadura sp. DC4 TaxID=3055069 RepID=UPI0025AF0AFE|nr:LmbU family transcriptional regulator [Actinomadura sp. DC4]MDN3357539.1 LmbU family transcriptional regulator [Actinomadura sp. DC4]